MHEKQIWCSWNKLILKFRFWAYILHFIFPKSVFLAQNIGNQFVIMPMSWIRFQAHTHTSAQGFRELNWKCWLLSRDLTRNWAKGISTSWFLQFVQRTALVCMMEVFIFLLSFCENYWIPRGCPQFLTITLSTV